jgi:hypothetical protein
VVIGNYNGKPKSLLCCFITQNDDIMNNMVIYNGTETLERLVTVVNYHSIVYNIVPGPVL